MDTIAKPNSNLIALTVALWRFITAHYHTDTTRACGRIVGTRPSNVHNLAVYRAHTKNATMKMPANGTTPKHTKSIPKAESQWSSSRTNGRNGQSPVIAR